MLALLCALSFLIACTGTGAVKAWVERRQNRSDNTGRLLDAPNHRSSHARPTPRGGGIAIVLAFTVCATAWSLQSHADMTFTMALLPAAGVVALTGFLDDWGWGVSAKRRLVIHFAAAALFLVLAGGSPDLRVGDYRLHTPWLINVLAALWLVWMLNLFNFMDGIDGIASIEAITVCLGGAWVSYLAAPSGDWTLPLLLAAAAAGFLVWNHPPARIFMGDAGSCFLGFSLGCLALRAQTQADGLFWAWAILLGCFVLDATLTLMRRVLSGQRFDEAHRSHAYQIAARRWGSHRRVTYAVALINVVWLLPLATAVALDHLDGVVALGIAYTPLVALACLLGAGKPDAN